MDDVTLNLSIKQKSLNKHNENNFSIVIPKISFGKNEKQIKFMYPPRIISKIRVVGPYRVTRSNC